MFLSNFKFKKIKPWVTLVLLVTTLVISTGFYKLSINIQELYPNFNPGLNLAYTTNLLSQNEREIRVLFYGQSITRDQWTEEVTRGLKRRFPQADIVSKNLAIGGFSSQLLVLNVERDLINFYPDLIIFHVYGAHDKYEQIIQKMRTLTTADIAIQTDHYAGSNSDWSRFMNQYFLPRMAEKYHCELINVRSIWQEYLSKHNYQPQELLRDNIHLNSHGNLLMSQIIKAYLVVNPQAQDIWEDRVKTYQVNRDIQWNNGQLNLEFVGNRVEAIASLFGEAEAEIFIDGKHPSEIPDLYSFTRANYDDTVDWPWDVSAPFRINWESPLQAEDWEIEILEIESTAENMLFNFKLTGSKTGFDGIGNNGEKFTSNSHRIVILPEDWWLKTVNYKVSPIKPGYQLRFSSKLLGTDIYQKPKFRGFHRESTVILAQGLTNEKHTLTIIPRESGKVPITAIRIYKPPLDPAKLNLEEINPEQWIEEKGKRMKN
ncbi:MAG: SGNH/GDSL hydrolase family protein [Gloeocapsa sp. DLM2.Bin57]|nr:MAG: SGNH/GDSL hydrolase family protein [Gloeocapsa sp. DLM2.Bin57]